MRCPFCGNDDTQVKDSRPTEDGSAIRRRRACPECAERFSTFERVQSREMIVQKSEGRMQPFDRDKIIKSMQIALQKRPVDLNEIERSANEIVSQVEKQGEAEITSGAIGESVMKALQKLDMIAYIRYASVYRNFRDPEDFNAFVDDLKKLPVAG